MTDKLGQPAQAALARRDSAASENAWQPEAAIDDKPLDWELLVRRCLGRLDLAERLLKSFESRFPADLQHIEDCFEGDPAELARLVHQLKGAAANISAPELHSIMSRLELAVRAQQRDAARDCVAEAKRAWERYQEFQCSSIHRSNS